MSINYLEKITEIYCFVSVDEGGEGIIAKQLDMSDGKAFIHFVCDDKDQVESLKSIAKKIAEQTGWKIKLIKLTNREDLEDIS